MKNSRLGASSILLTLSIVLVFFLVGFGVLITYQNKQTATIVSDNSPTPTVLVLPPTKISPSPTITSLATVSATLAE